MLDKYLCSAVFNWHGHINETDTETEANVETDMETDTETDMETDTETDTETDMETDMERTRKRTWKWTRKQNWNIFAKFPYGAIVAIVPYGLPMTHHDESSNSAISL